MFCPQCGKELIEVEGNHICIDCQKIIIRTDGSISQPVTQTQQETEPIVNVETLKNAASSATVAAKKVKKPIWIRVALILVIVCFFFPFCTVSCGSETIEASGFEAMIGSSEDDIAANAFLIISILLIGLALVVSFASDSHNTPVAIAIISAVAAFFLFLFRVTLLSYYELMEHKAYVTVQTEWGWWACLLLLIAAVVLSVMWKKEKQSSSPPTPDPNPYGYGAVL